MRAGVRLLRIYGTEFLEKYFTPDVMMELLEEQFRAEDNHREITAIIEAREKYYLSKLTEA